MGSLDYKYSYLIGVLVFVFVWVLIFVKNKYSRQEMLYLAFFGMLFGPIANYLWYTRDWWNPPNILGLRVGLEDFFLGIAHIGIVAVIYEWFFGKKYDTELKITWTTVFDTAVIKRFTLFVVITLTPMLVLYYLVGLHSFWANLVGLVIGGTYILTKRPDLWRDIFYTAILMPLISTPAFWLPEIITPGWIDKFWMFSNLSGITLLKIPIEDLIWYSLVGYCLGAFYEYVFELKCKS